MLTTKYNSIIDPGLLLPYPAFFLGTYLPSDFKGAAIMRPKKIVNICYLLSLEYYEM